jgi:hypothetical protein
MDQVLKRILIIFLACLVISCNIPAFADQFVHGYMRSNGTYVRPYYRSSPNGTVTDNFSYRGNVNPYTGAVGTSRYIHDKTSPYYQGPDSHGRVGHSSAPFQGQGYGQFQFGYIESATNLPRTQFRQPLHAAIYDDRNGRLPSRPLKAGLC